METDSMETWERRLDAAKQKHRPKLKNWTKDRFNFERSSDFERTAASSSHIREITHLSPGPESTIDRISCRNITPDQFIQHYEVAQIPCLISDIPQVEGWQALHLWKFHNRELFKHQLGDRMFKVGEDDDGYKVKVKMTYFMKYLQNTQDDSPLYIFDSNYDDDPVSNCLLQHYRVPSYFPDDLFELVGESRRPPYRWFLVGPKRSGTCVHIDPLGTSAWNTLLEGRKRWVLFRPEVSKSIVKGLDVIRKGEDDESVNYFVDILPRIREKHGSTIGPIIEFTQMPGDTVFVPGEWWHAVLNLDNTIAITQNYCSRVNFDAVWRKTRSGRKKMSVKWLEKLRDRYPELHSRALRLNAEDDFEMYDKEKARAEKEAKEKKREAKKMKGKFEEVKAESQSLRLEEEERKSSEVVEMIDSKHFAEESRSKKKKSI